MTKVAVLGLGTMGIGMAVNLAKAGHSVRGYNRSEGRKGPLVDAGGDYFTDPKRAAEDVEIVIVCLANDDATRAVVLESGLASALSRGALMIDAGTTSLPLTQALHAACESNGVGFIDAPVTGSKKGAESGQLTFMAGGANSAIERARPLFDIMGRHVVHAGLRVGDGQRIKYCLNMTQAIVLQGVLEGYALAQAQGLQLETLAEVFDHSAGKTGVGAFKTPYLTARDFEPHFRLDLMQKDLHLALDAARRASQPVPLASAVTSLYDLAAHRGWGREDFLATAKLLEIDANDS